MGNKLIVTAAPHITSPDTTQKIMQRVCLALVPTLIASVIIFGINALILTLITVVACVFFEWASCKLMGREAPLGDFSAVVTGMLLAFNLPSTLPFWMPIVGAFIAIVVVKQLFGGLGYNFANPAIVGRIAMAMGFAGAMSSYGFPQGVDATSAATPLSSAAQGIDYVTLLLGNHGGVLGETCAITLLLGGIYLIATKVISPVIPVTYLATVAVLSAVSGHDPIVQL
ncbi:MAG: RnfABCDGE type electron transport complex subunit D, partial [Oscillospiraceae bacterium]|nr:RnfABCDGE type electron transport complex subunit D [Oscillospiraceae bacterium]